MIAMGYFLQVRARRQHDRLRNRLLEQGMVEPQLHRGLLSLRLLRAPPSHYLLLLLHCPGKEQYDTNQTEFKYNLIFFNTIWSLKIT